MLKQVVRVSVKWLQLTVGCICSVRFETLNYQLPINLIRSKNIEYTTEPHITYTPCYTQYGLLR
jgi:hypothetical protein